MSSASSASSMSSASASSASSASCGMQVPKLGCLLGGGAFAHVYNSIDKKSAIKVQYTEDYCATREVSIMSCLSHPNIMTADNYTTDGIKTFITMQKGKCLYGDFNLRPPTVLNIIWGILNGLNYMHDNNIIHRDLKSSNILVFDDRYNDVRICDFGLSKYFTTAVEGVTHTNIVQTLHYRAPEVAMGMEYGFQIDIWSVGVIILELLSGDGFDRSHVECDINDEQAFIFKWGSMVNGPPINCWGDIDKKWFVECKLNSMIRVPMTHPLVQLALECLSWDSNLRPTAREALNHSCFSEFYLLESAPIPVVPIVWYIHDPLRQPNINPNMKCSTYAWLWEICRAFNITNTIIFIYAVIDYYLQIARIDENCLPTVVCAALLVNIHLNSLDLIDANMIMETAGRIFTEEMIEVVFCDMVYCCKIPFIQILHAVNQFQFTKKQWHLIAMVIASGQTINDLPVSIELASTVSYSTIIEKIDMDHTCEMYKYAQALGIEAHTTGIEDVVNSM